MLNLRRRLLPFFTVAFVIFLGGTLGYVFIEDWSVGDAFYMTVITLTTVGFGEVQPLSPGGRWFTAVLILFGVGTIAYGISTMGEYVLAAGMSGHFRRRRIMNKISRLEEHIIVCGYGRVGRSTVETLHQNKRQVVIVEKEADRVQAALAEGLLVVQGDATRDEVLQESGIARAWGLIVSTGDDSLNLFIVLSARALNAELYIVARSVSIDNERKMIQAGANRVVSPYRIGGKHMANITIRPHVTDFLDVVTLDGGLELWLEEFIIGPNSPLVGQTVGQIDIRRETGVTLVAVIRASGGGTLTPTADTLLNVGDELIVLGTREQLAVLERLADSTLGHQHPP